MPNGGMPIQPSEKVYQLLQFEFSEAKQLNLNIVVLECQIVPIYY